MLGRVAAVPVSDRCLYAGVVEHSVDVRPHARGRGTGTALLTAFITSTEAAGIWTIQSGIFPENGSSLALVVLIERRSSAIAWPVPVILRVTSLPPEGPINQVPTQSRPEPTEKPPPCGGTAGRELLQCGLLLLALGLAGDLGDLPDQADGSP